MNLSLTYLLKPGLIRLFSWFIVPCFYGSTRQPFPLSVPGWHIVRLSPHLFLECIKEMTTEWQEHTSKIPNVSQGNAFPKIRRLTSIERKIRVSQDNGVGEGGKQHFGNGNCMYRCAVMTWSSVFKIENCQRMQHVQSIMENYIRNVVWLNLQKVAFRSYLDHIQKVSD